MLKKDTFCPFKRVGGGGYVPPVPMLMFRVIIQLNKNNAWGIKIIHQYDFNNVNNNNNN